MSDEEFVNPIVKDVLEFVVFLGSELLHQIRFLLLSISGLNLLRVDLGGSDVLLLFAVGRLQ